MRETESYALWLVPGGELYHRLSQIITDLSRKHGAPAFEPHVTLLSHIPGVEDAVAAHCERLADRIEPYSIRLTKLDQMNEYYRCFFVRVLETPAVVGANSEARDVFGLQQGSPYMPHLSLLYGDFSAATKYPIIESLGESWKLEFYVDRFHLIDGRGGPAEWRRLKEFAFGEQNPLGRLA